jgi:hypothetical protein
MKNKLLFLVAFVFAAVTFSSCNEDEILSQDFEVVLHSDFTVNNTTDTIFTGEQLLDAAAQNSDIEKYKEHIEDMTLTKVTYFLTAFNGAADQELITGAIDVADTSGANRVNLTGMMNTNMASLLNNETQLTLNQAGMTLIGERIQNAPHALRVYYNGSVNKKPLDFTIRVKYYLTMKAKII